MTSENNTSYNYVQGYVAMNWHFNIKHTASDEKYPVGEEKKQRAVSELQKVKMASI